MRKIVCIVMVFVALLSCIAFAEIDVSDMSFSELVEARELITQAMWASDEWQEVEVPAGLYQIGVDIPAGYWTVRPAGVNTCMIKYGNTLEDNGNELDYPCVSEQITDPEDGYAKYNSITELSWQMEEGYYFSTDQTVIFTPYQGTNLGFK